MSLTFRQIEDAIIAALQATAPWTTTGTVMTYGGQLAVPSLEELIIKLPAAFVAYSGSKYTWVDGHTFRDAPTFSVLIVTQSLRTYKDINEDIRLNATTGAYALIEAVKGALSAQNLGLTAMERLRPIDTKLLVATQTRVAYEMNFEGLFDTNFA